MGKHCEGLSIGKHSPKGVNGGGTEEKKNTNSQLAFKILSIKNNSSNKKKWVFLAIITEFNFSLLF